MQYIQTKKILNSGIIIDLRSVNKHDAENLLMFFKQVSAETDFLIRYPEELKMTIEQEIDFIDSIVLSDYDQMILCVHEGKIVGNGQINFKNAFKIKHRVGISLAILKAYWGQGIGTLLIHEMLKIAQEHTISQVELEYIEGNTRGKQLYEKFGFIETGRRPNAYRFKNGNAYDEIIMVKKLR